MALSTSYYRLIPPLEVSKGAQSQGILDIRDFSLLDNTFTPESGGAGNCGVLFEELQRKTDNASLRWITLQNAVPETLKSLASSLSYASRIEAHDMHAKTIFERFIFRFSMFQYAQVYAETGCEVLTPQADHSETQLAIYLPYFKWNPTSRNMSRDYPTLTEYAQPSVFHSSLERENNGEGNRHKLPIVVHQLWLFVPASKTIVSYYPPASAYADSQLDVDIDAALKPTAPGFDEVYTDVMDDSYVLAANIVRQTCLLQISGPLVKTPMVSFLEQAVASISGKRIEAYASFSASIAKGDDSHLTTSQGRHREIQLLLEIIMTVEELQSFLFVLNSQLIVISQMRETYAEIQKGQQISPKALPLLSKTFDDILRIKKDVERLVESATQIQAAMVQLLDLKQKEANLLEAQYARQRAEEAAIQTQQAAQQGRTLILFTVTTIMFLPLSFFTSYFGMNVQDITGDDGNAMTQRNFWSVCAPITVTVVTLVVLAAFNDSVRAFVGRLNERLRR